MAELGSELGLSCSGGPCGIISLFVLQSHSRLLETTTVHRDRQTHQLSNYVQVAPVEEIVAQVTMAHPTTWRLMSSLGLDSMCPQLYLFFSSSWP